ncbi:NADPH-dependent FMN reductase [Micromonospora sp. CPCC 206061]|uniref:NADPH-dependent FMN reductase n=1 Tax=Micromonospora sp. CPCC 206061 TaxID=3122410 RepID=UPI002FF1AF42
MRSVVLIGNPKVGSRTAAAAVRVADALRQALHRHGAAVADAGVVDLSVLARHLLDPSGDRAAVDDALGLVRAAGLLVVASPTFKASYAGLLKVFLDVLPPRGLSGAVAVPVMTAASAGHRYAVDTYLRPVLMELGAVVPTPGLSVLEAEFEVIDEVFAKWSVSAIPTLAALLGPGEG